jgi:hypothetical protein
MVNVMQPYRTFNLKEAADFLGFKDTEGLREKAKRGIIPGCKPGKEWRFYELDLIEYMQSLYEHYKKHDVVSGVNRKWQSVKEKAVRTIGHDSRSTESEYNNLLNVSHVRKPKNMKTI